MQGSILSAGLPDGPRIPTLPEPPAPKDVPRFGRLAPEVPKDKGLTLQASDVDLTPAIKAADTDANTRAGSTDAKAAPNIAFRVAAPESKAKQ
jgi:hypothetical protein